jgi:hypothetical protein
MNGRLAFGLTVTAVGWSAALVGAALLFPAYSDGSSLVAYNGAWVLGLIGVPAAVAAAVWFVLHRRCTVGAGTAIAWTLVSLLFLSSLVSAGSIGLFMLPVVALLAFATIFTPSAGG